MTTPTNNEETTNRAVALGAGTLGARLQVAEHARPIRIVERFARLADYPCLLPS